MPKFYCDYCDVFLTHDSSSVRKAHNLGRVHQQNVRDHYAAVAAELAEVEQLERQVPKAVAETRGLRMPPPMTEPTLSNSGRDPYGILPTPWMPLPIPYGMPARPGFPNTYHIPADFKPQAPPGVTPPDPTPFIQANMMPGMPGYIPNITSAQALGLIQPPPNLPANFGQMQQDFQQGYRQPQRNDRR